ncbi:MAG: iron-sulfur cluster insertion protein ErpA [Candidatus Dasytiphilus stammeri]
MKKQIDLTESALKKIKSLISQKNNFNLKLRIYITGGGCSGFQYGFRLDEHTYPDDLIIEKLDIKLVVDAMSFQYLIGSCIDYVEKLEGSQFMIQNPNAKITCSCGASFTP